MAPPGRPQIPLISLQIGRQGLSPPPATDVVVSSHHADSQPGHGDTMGVSEPPLDHSPRPDWLRFGRGWFKVIIFAIPPFSWLQLQQGLPRPKSLHKSIFNLSSALLRPTWNIGYNYLLKLMLPFLTKK